MTARKADSVELRLPCKPEYVGVVRLAMSGIASRMRFSYEEVEDIKTAVGEACTTSVEWAKRNGRSDTELIIQSIIDGDSLKIAIKDSAGPRTEISEQSTSEYSAEGIGALFITLFVDEVRVTPSEDGTLIEMVKKAG